MGHAAKETVVLRAKVARAFLDRPGEGLSNAALQVVLCMPKFPEVSTKGSAGWKSAFAEASRARDKLNHTLQYLRTARILDRSGDGWNLIDEAAAQALCAAAAELAPVSGRRHLQVLQGGKA